MQHNKANPKIQTALIIFALVFMFTYLEQTKQLE